MGTNAQSSWKGVKLWLLRMTLLGPNISLMVGAFSFALATNASQKDQRELSGWPRRRLMKRLRNAGIFFLLALPLIGALIFHHRLMEIDRATDRYLSLALFCVAGVSAICGWHMVWQADNLIAGSETAEGYLTFQAAQATWQSRPRCTPPPLA